MNALGRFLTLVKRRRVGIVTRCAVGVRIMPCPRLMFLPTTWGAVNRFLSCFSPTTDPLSLEGPPCDADDIEEGEGCGGRRRQAETLTEEQVVHNFINSEHEN